MRPTLLSTIPRPVALVAAAMLLVALVTRIAPPASAAPGDVSADFDPGANSTVSAVAAQWDGKIVIAGDFTNVGGQERKHLARLDADGTLDGSFAPVIENREPYSNPSVSSVAVQADGRIIIAGTFSHVNGAERYHVARLHANGDMDSGFNPAPNGPVKSVTVQADGKVILGGYFTKVGKVARQRIARVHANGTLDRAFAPTADSAVRFTAIQADGKILIAGDFARVRGVARARLARLEKNGTLDKSFAPNIDYLVETLAMQADGQILIGGFLYYYYGVPQSKVTRFHSSGSRDVGFTLWVNHSVRALAVQADGRILIAGPFTTVNGLARPGIARLNPDGTLDRTFAANVAGSVSSLAVQANGEILVAGNITSVGGIDRGNMARLENDAATESLGAPDAKTVRWLRAGAASETEHVSFELSTDGGNTYKPLGTGRRIAGGWELSGLSLPSSGEIRARGRTGSGNFSGPASGVVQTLAAFGTAAPEISVARQPGGNIADGGSASFGSVIVGENASATFMIRNSGTASLTGLGISIDGPDANMFTVTSKPRAPVAGGGATFIVRFTPTSSGPKSAILHIASNDADENPFEIILTATGTRSTNANLAALSLSAGTLAPPFTSGTTEYEASVGYLTTSLTVTPKVAHPAATVTVNGTAVISGNASGPIALRIGANIVSVVVTAGDGFSAKIYRVVITRREPIPGNVDLDFHPSLDGSAASMAIQADGKIVIGGTFTKAQGVDRFLVARLHADGTLDAPFNAHLYAGSAPTVSSVAVQPDGKILIAGRFGGVGGLARLGLGRLNPDGTLDQAFNAKVDRAVSSIALQPDGKIVIAGFFTSVAGVARNGLARLHADGSLDLGFDVLFPDDDFAVISAALQPDGRILIAGYFASVNGVARNRVARLHPDGSLDTDFSDPFPRDAYSYQVSPAEVQPDGKVMVVGPYSTQAGVAYNRMMRLGAGGTLDADFNPNVKGQVSCLAVQADGRILIGGEFTTVGGTARNYIARLNPNGTLDAGFNPNADGPVSCLAVQANGQVIVGGSFFNVGGGARKYLARLANEPATQSLTVANASRVEWLRSGSSPETLRAAFDLSVDGGNTYTELGAGTRIPGGWELTGLSLPARGEVRVRAMTTGGIRNGASSGIVQTITPFGGAAPEIAIEQPPGTDIASGGTADFGEVAVGDDATLTFTIRNHGTASLAARGVTVNGLDQAMFAVTAYPAAHVSGGGGSTTFAVRFTPASLGQKSAVLQIASDDGDEGAFAIHLLGTGTLRTNAKLAALSLSAGSLSPAFAGAVTSYTAAVDYLTTSISVTPTVAQRMATVAVNGVAVSSGSVSAPISLRLGDNVITILVTAGDAVHTMTYSIHVNRAAAKPGDLDLDFNPVLSSWVASMAVQPDGKILVGGPNTVNGTPRNFLARLNEDGTLDTAFNPDTNLHPYAMAVQADGKIVIGGAFAFVYGGTPYYLARLNGDGTIDPLFKPEVNNSVHAISMQTDGKILLTGAFNVIGGVARDRFARLHPDGRLDTNFNPNVAGSVHCIAVQTDEKIVIGGPFTSVNGTVRNRLARFHSDGTLDVEFHPDASDVVSSLQVQADGKIVIGGSFTSVDGVARNRAARLHADGAVDAAFNPETVFPSNAVDCSVLVVGQAGGKTIVRRQYAIPYAGYSVGYSYLDRLHADGTMDHGFKANFPPNLPRRAFYSAAVQADGMILVDGWSATEYGPVRNYLVRLANDPATQDLSVINSNRVQWQRGGSSPESSQVTFDLSTDGGATYTALGMGMRFANGWELNDLSLPATGKIRARARTTGSAHNGSSGLVESTTAFGFASPAAGHDGLLDSRSAASGHRALADHDRDGVPELLEQAFGLNPNCSGAADLPQAVNEGGYLTMTISKRPGVAYEVQSAGTLLPGQPDSFSPATTTVLIDNATTLKVRDHVPIGAQTSRYLRVKVTAAP